MRLIDADALADKLGIKADCKECEYAYGAFCSKSSEFVNACEAIFDAPTAQPLTDEDYMELRDRFGREVEFVVEDMISGKGERWGIT